MAIHSNILGSVTITGEDAKAFTRMVTHGRTNQAAIQSLKEGRKMVAEYAKKGSVSIKLNPPKDRSAKK
jgi:hypothetical protein